MGEARTLPVVSEPYGTTKGTALQGPTPVRRHRLSTPAGLAVELLELGASLHRIEVPDGHGGTVPLSLGLETLTEREEPDRNPYLGVTVGRYANRIRDGRFGIDGRSFTLEPNEGHTHLHGGPVGFSHVVWDATPGDRSVTFRRVSSGGEMGYPGRLDVTVTYEVHDRTIRIVHEATTDAATIVSMTNHTYWNLGGPAEERVDHHRVCIAADHFVPVDAALLPSGAPEAVAGTPFDLRSSPELSDRLVLLPDGYDHCYPVPGTGFRRHARVDHPASGRSLEVWSDQPAVQFYSGGMLGGGPGAGGRNHDRFAALCLEPEHVPDAPNLAWAPSPVLRPGERYRHELEFRLDWDRR